jgi:hypothetical protein
MLFWVTTPLLALALVFLYVCGRSHFSAHGELVLTAAGRRSLRRPPQHVALDAIIPGSAYDKTDSSWGREDAGEALEMLELAFSVLADTTPSRLRRLGGMTVCCQMAHAMLPRPPLTRHHLVKSAGARLIRALDIVAFGCRLLRKSLSASAGSPRPERVVVQPWQFLEQGATDPHGLQPFEDDPLEAFRALVTSLESDQTGLRPPPPRASAGSQT